MTKTKSKRKEKVNQTGKILIIGFSDRVVPTPQISMLAKGR